MPKHAILDTRVRRCDDRTARPEMFCPYRAQGCCLSALATLCPDLNPPPAVYSEMRPLDNEFGIVIFIRRFENRFRTNDLTGNVAFGFLLLNLFSRVPTSGVSTTVISTENYAWQFICSYERFCTNFVLARFLICSYSGRTDGHSSTVHHYLIETGRSDIGACWLMTGLRLARLGFHMLFAKNSQT